MSGSIDVPEASGGCTVLVVDDDEGIREAMGAVLVDEGHRVFTAANGREAMDRLQGGLRPALILLDLMMPVMDGRQFRAAQLADSRLRQIPVVVITAGGDSGPRREMAVQAWLPKPIELDRLLEEVDKHRPVGRA